MDLFKDKGFVITALGALLLFALVMTDRVDAMLLVGWLGGAAGPTVGRFRTNRPQPTRREEPK